MIKYQILENDEISFPQYCMILTFISPVGLDIPKHNEPAYPVEAYGHGHIEKILQVLEGAGPIKVTQG